MPPLMLLQEALGIHLFKTVNVVGKTSKSF